MKFIFKKIVKFFLIDNQEKITGIPIYNGYYWRLYPENKSK